MLTFSLNSVALKWSVFFRDAGIAVFEEYFAVVMKQLGLTPSRIGMTMPIIHISESR